LLVETSELEMVFSDGVPVPTGGAANLGSTCQWGTAATNLTITVLPGDEFYSGCEACEPLDLGDDWVDGSASFWTALVVSGDTTIQLLAVGLGLDEPDFVDLVRSVVDRV
jgi:hypothetical protein